MRYLKLFLVAVASFLLMYTMFQYLERYTNDTKFAPYAVGEMAPLTYFGNPERLKDITVLLEDGSSYSINADEGRVRLINLWASWCIPCLREMPALDRLQAKLGGPDFEVVAVNQDFEGVPVARAYMDRLELKHLKLYTDPTTLSSSRIANNELPTTLIIDKDGYVVAKFVGDREWDSDEAIELFEFLIGEGASQQDQQ